MAEIEDLETATTTSPVGQRLRAAREAKGLSLEDLATQTRIPLRHLEAIETGDWSRLPAPTYTVGFAKSYASAVGLDRAEIGEEVRAEVGSTRPAETTTNEVFEPADPARTMPRWLVMTAITAIVLVVIGMTWFNGRALQDSEPAAVEAADEAPEASTPAEGQQAAPAAQGPVVLTAADPVWLRVYERDGRTLFEGELATGQSYEVPQTATDPMLLTGKPEALRVTVAGEAAPPVGPPAQTVSDVSLRAGDIMGRGDGSGVTLPAPSAPPGVQNTAG